MLKHIRLKSYFNHQDRRCCPFGNTICPAKEFCPAQILISVLWKTESIRLSIGLGSDVRDRRRTNVTHLGFTIPSLRFCSTFELDFNSSCNKNLWKDNFFERPYCHDKLISFTSFSPPPSSQYINIRTVSSYMLKYSDEFELKFPDLSTMGFQPSKHIIKSGMYP